MYACVYSCVKVSVSVSVSVSGSVRLCVFQDLHTIVARVLFVLCFLLPWCSREPRDILYFAMQGCTELTSCFFLSGDCVLKHAQACVGLCGCQWLHLVKTFLHSIRNFICY
jgi:hypothetical protein